MYESLGQNIAKRLEAKDSPAAVGLTASDGQVVVGSGYLFGDRR